MRREIVCYKITDSEGVHYTPLTMDVRDCLDKYHDFKVVEMKKVVATFSSADIYDSGEYKLKPARYLQKLNLKVVDYYYLNEEGAEVSVGRQGLPFTRKELAEKLDKIQAENIYMIRTRIEDFPCYISKEMILKLSDIEEVC